MDTTFEYKGRTVRLSVKQEDGGWQYHYRINEGMAHVSGVLHSTENEALAAGDAEARAEVDEERI